MSEGAKVGRKLPFFKWFEKFVMLSPTRTIHHIYTPQLLLLKVARGKPYYIAPPPPYFWNWEGHDSRAPCYDIILWQPSHPFCFHVLPLKMYGPRQTCQMLYKTTPFLHWMLHYWTTVCATALKPPKKISYFRYFVSCLSCYRNV